MPMPVAHMRKPAFAMSKAKSVGSVKRELLPKKGSGTSAPT